MPFCALASCILLHRRTLRTAHPTLLLALFALACGNVDPDGPDRVEGQFEFTSSPPAGAHDGNGRGGPGLGNVDSDASGGAGNGAGAERTVEETDLYRLEGDRLYYLNGYRGLMVFDVSHVDEPRLLGRSPIFGHPVEMIVRNGVATVVVADWYGSMDDGSPFRGSVVRGLDATDPTNITVLGEARLGGWVRDTRVVGDVLYAVSEEYSWNYGWGSSGGAVHVGGGGNKMVVSSVSFANGQIESKGRYEAPGWGGVFNVTSNSILFAHDVATENNPDYYAVPRTALVYIDISDPQGAIQPRGALEFEGSISGWSADNGRWNLNFADGVTANAFACAQSYCGDGSGYVLVTADFENPDTPILRSTLDIEGGSWSPTARFDAGRMYLAPSHSWWGDGSETPVRIFDISDPDNPAPAGETSIPGSVWLFMPSGDRLFALGNEYDPNSVYGSSQVSLSYLDVTDAAEPTLIGTSSFGEGWAWTPAAGTFKAFTKSDTEGLVVLPFSGWSHHDYRYHNGLQLIEFSPESIATAGAALTKGWAERGIFVQDRLVSLSNLALSVIDYTNRQSPEVITELTLARNVVDAKPSGQTLTELSSDWWGNDVSHSTLRVLPLDQAEETVTGSELASLEIEGVGARVFHNGNFSYVVTSVENSVECPSNHPRFEGQDAPRCTSWHDQVQVVDRSNGSATLRGTIALPEGGWYRGWGWYGCYAWDWYHGADVVQAGGDTLAFRRWVPNYGENNEYIDSHQSLLVVNLSDPDAPTLASTVITNDQNGWWGNMRAIGDTLYASHYEWVRPPGSQRNTEGEVRYYLDRIDLSDPQNPRVDAKINVPGFLVGASETDPSLIFTIDYRWTQNGEKNEFNVLRLQGDRAYLQSTVALDGWVGNTFVRGNRAYFSAERLVDTQNWRTVVELYQIDVSNPRQPQVFRSEGQDGWGWLVGIEGDRALVVSGWGSVGLDIYQLSDGAPSYDRFVRTRGFSPSSLARQGNSLFLASGYWGVQRIDL